MRHLLPAPPQPCVDVADEGVLLLDPGVEEARAGRATARAASSGSSLSGQQRDAERADGARVGRDDHLGAGLARHGRGQRVGGEGHALAEDDLADRAAALHAVQVVLDDRVVDAGDDRGCSTPRGHRLVDDLGHEDRAVLARARRRRRRRARLAPSCATSSMPANRLPCSSMKEPVPALQASFIARRRRAPRRGGCTWRPGRRSRRWCRRAAS